MCNQLGAQGRGYDLGEDADRSLGAGIHQVEGWRLRQSVFEGLLKFKVWSVVQKGATSLNVDSLFVKLCEISPSFRIMFNRRQFHIVYKGIALPDLLGMHHNVWFALVVFILVEQSLP